MNTKAKVILIGTAFLAAAAGSAVAFNGCGYCYQGGPGFQGRGQSYQVPGNPPCMQPMKWRRMQGQGPMRGMNPSPMRGVYRLNDLTDEQLQQLDALRQAQQEWRAGRQQSMLAHRAELKNRVDAILTEEQRQTLNQWNPGNY